MEFVEEYFKNKTLHYYIVESVTMVNGKEVETSKNIVNSIFKHKRTDYIPDDVAEYGKIRFNRTVGEISPDNGYSYIELETMRVTNTLEHGCIIDELEDSNSKVFTYIDSEGRFLYEIMSETQMVES